MIAVAVIDEENEEDLEEQINAFFKSLTDESFIDIKYATSHFLSNTNEQIYSYSALIIYRIIPK